MPERKGNFRLCLSYLVAIYDFVEIHLTTSCFEEKRSELSPPSWIPEARADERRRPRYDDIGCDRQPRKTVVADWYVAVGSENEG
ncbi:hypothetical protein EVAR_18193_1 [Eumeta japonica]|uniref:Uncharacterized protein n=1 Tax=Eumeta variegata TaxID=151549 RepID=A0A4C1UXA0_EUMVA|nr:hypothetical protein EVAR_18193_1 [Eumeta japonica]